MQMLESVAKKCRAAEGTSRGGVDGFARWGGKRGNSDRGLEVRGGGSKGLQTIESVRKENMESNLGSKLGRGEQSGRETIGGSGWMFGR